MSDFDDIMDEWAEGDDEDFGDSFIDDEEDEDDGSFSINLDNAYDEPKQAKSSKGKSDTDTASSSKAGVFKTGTKMYIIGAVIIIVALLGIVLGTRIHRARAEKAKQKQIEIEEQAAIDAEEAIRQAELDEEVTAKRQENSEKTVEELATNERVDVSEQVPETSKPAEEREAVPASVMNTADESSWIVFTDADGMVINEEYTQLVFTIMHIEHRVKVVDYNQNVEVKTVLSGSLSGLGGTYELTVPYELGKSLRAGNFFNVNVKLGTYDGKVVVDEISYK